MASGGRWNSGPIAGGSSGGLRWKARALGDDDAEETLSEQLENSLSLGSKSPAPFRRRDGSVLSDEADGAISDLASEAGGSFTQKSHAYQASISSDEGHQLHDQSKRTFKPHRPGIPADRRGLAGQRGFAAQIWPPGEISGDGRRDTSGDSGSFPSWNSNSRHQDSDPFSVSHWTESDVMSSAYTSSGGPNYRVSPSVHPPNIVEPDFDLSKRMDGILQQQRMKTQLQNTGGRRGSGWSSQESSWSTMDGARGSGRSSRESSWSGGLDGRGRPSQTQHCCMHCRSDVCAAYSCFPIGNCCDDGRCRNCSHYCCHPSTTSAVSCHGDPGPRRREMPIVREEERQPRKSQIQPVFGGSSYVLCYKCSVLIQLPPDFNLSAQRRNKLQCGACSNVVVFLLAERNRIVPANTTSLPSNAGPAVDESIASSSQRARDEEYSSPEYETDSSHATKGKKKGNPSALHKLMGYFSATDVLAPENREVRRRG